MQDVSATMLGDSRDCGVIGVGPALMLVPRLLQLHRRVIDWCRRETPQLVVLCDWGAFNARLLQPLRDLNIPVLYYFPPGSWQKKGARGLTIVPFVTRVATPFPWSAERLTKAGANAEWVGHPILETVHSLGENSAEREQLRREFGVQKNEKLVVLMPGSRALELRFIAPHLAQTATLLQRDSLQHHSSTRSTIRCIVAVPKGSVARVRRYFAEDVAIIEGRAPELLMACDAAIVKSGTSTLEAAVADAPQVVVYDAPAILQWQWRLMGGSKKIPFVAMPNIIAEREIVRELLGPNCRPRAIVQALELLLNDEATRQKMRENYAEVRRVLGSELKTNATTRTAEIIEEMVSQAQIM